MVIEKFLSEIPLLETQSLLLRRITLDDVDDIFEFSSDIEVAHHMTWEANRNKEETLNNFVNVVIEGYKRGQSADWAIVHKGSNKVIGTCAFVDWSNQHSKAEVGYVLNKNYWGYGFATEALSELIKFGFECISLNRIEGGCDIDNIGSENVMLKVGMKFEGILRKNEFIKGKFRDTKIFAILKEDFYS